MGLIKRIMGKKRKRDTVIKIYKCDICWNHVGTVTQCFYGCSIKICPKCINHQIKIKRVPKRNLGNTNMYKVSYKCPQCQRKVRYFPHRQTGYDLMKPEDDIFSDWCRDKPFVLLNIMNKFVDTYTNTDSDEESTYAEESEDEIVQSMEQLPMEAFIPPPPPLPPVEWLGSSSSSTDPETSGI